MNILHSMLDSIGLPFYQFDRSSLEDYYYEHFDDSKTRYDTKRFFEQDLEPFKNNIKRKQISLPRHPISTFRYFLDGSRKPYKIGDLITSDYKFVPVVSGQISVGCCYRNDNSEIKKHKLNQKNVLLLYDDIESGDLATLKNKIESNTWKGIDFKLEKYSFKANQDSSPTNSAIAKIQSIMQDMEIELLNDMTTSKYLDTENMLVIDGSLQFLKQRFKPEIFYYVIGISKSFNTNLKGLFKGNTQIGAMLTELEFGQRTPVFRFPIDRGKQSYTLGAWYLRIREKSNVKSPLEGIIKVEKMATQEDLDNDGFPSESVDNLSASIIAERLPTCHGNDERWASHIYPIYLTEKMIKSSFRSDTFFMNIF